ncbi:MAG: OmpA family protein [Bacteroidota bacterium]
MMSVGMVAQKSKADKLYAKAEYFRAIPKYRKAIKSNDQTARKESLINLADCYRILNDYSKAAEHYKAAIAIGNVSAETYYNYGTVLKSINQYQEALANFKIYIQTHPGDKKAANAVKSCLEINYLQSKPQEYALKNIQSINTKGSEFCPYYMNEELIYTGEKQSDFVEYTTNDVNGQPYLSVLSAMKNNEAFGKSKSFSKKINTSYHDGPASFSGDGKTIYLTRVTYISKPKKSFVNYAKLYTLVQNGKEWSKAISFPYNSDEYSCAHASVSADGSTLFFASDMPGGFGGKDIWMCKKNGNTWDKPVNLGADINTGGDEMFPYIRQDGTLFFSSNGLPGFGGLDVFSAKNNNGIWLLKRNEGLSLNSNADDFGVTFITDRTGYVSSNREGGSGKDDIYGFTYTRKYISVEGTVLLTKNINDPAQNAKVFLLDSDLSKIDSTRTDEKGYFGFNDLADRVYMAQVEDENVIFKNKSRYYLANKNGELARVTHKESNGMKFVFRNLPVDVSGISDLYGDEDGDLNLAGNILFGSDPAQPVSNKKITITNKFNDIIEQTTTNELGTFAFRNLIIGQDYTLTVEGGNFPEGTKITLTGKNGKEVKALRANGKGKFAFSLLAVDKTALDELSVEDKELSMTLKGFIYDQNKKPLANTKLSVFDKDQVIRNCITDEKGGFEFKNLTADKDYLFSLDADDKLNYVSKIYIADSKGRLYKEITKDKNNKFQYRLLEVDKSALGEFSVDDPWLEVLKMRNSGNNAAITIIENVTYVSGDYKIDEAGQYILDKVISVLKSDKNLIIELSSHTDSRGSDSYNLILSQKRAKAAVDYLIANGITKNRLKAIGYGETKLLNKCDNNANCSDEEHAINRRTEFKIQGIQKL